MAWSKEKRRAYNQAYQAKRADYLKAYRESHKAERNARLRARRAIDPAMRAAERVISKRYKSKRKAKQWEITLLNGMKQYLFGYTENDAITKWCKYVNSKRNLVAGVKEYNTKKGKTLQARVFAEEDRKAGELLADIERKSALGEIP